MSTTTTTAETANSGARLRGLRTSVDAKPETDALLGGRICESGCKAGTAAPEDGGAAETACDEGAAGIGDELACGADG